MSVEFYAVERGQDVIVRGRRVPMLEAHLGDQGKVLLVFDRRLGLHLDAGNYEAVTAFIADVMEGCFDARTHGPVFNQVHEITGASTE